MLVFDFEPTAYEQERCKQVKQTPKQRQREGKKQLAIAERSYAMAMRNSTTGQQYIRLQHVENVAAEYGIKLDVYWRWMKRLHEVNNASD